jgi:hypothetical protein
MSKGCDCDKDKRNISVVIIETDMLQRLTKISNISVKLEKQK